MTEQGNRPGQGGGSGDGSGRYRHVQFTASGAKPQGGPRHGRMAGDVWTKAARASQHMLRVPRAWALDLADLDAAERCGGEMVNIHDLERLTHYWAALRVVRARGFAFTRGHGEQIALGLEHWRPSRQEAEALAEKAAERENVGAVQLALFGGVRP